jgi:hypothetical protein
MMASSAHPSNAVSAPADDDVDACCAGLLLAGNASGGRATRPVRGTGTRGDNAAAVVSVGAAASPPGARRAEGGSPALALVSLACV